MAQRNIEETVAVKLRRQKYFRTELFAVVIVVLQGDRWLRSLKCTAEWKGKMSYL